MESPTPRISAIIITYNEERDIRACLQSVVWCDEIVILDSGSNDATLDICAEFTDRIVHSDGWPGFGPQKNHCLELATGDWVLSIDADERVPSPLRQDIERVIADPGFRIYEMPRLSYYCGRAMHHGGWWPDYVPRLFRRGTARFSDDLVHERLTFEGTPGRLRNPLHHYSYRDLSDVLLKIERYSSDGARNHLNRTRGGLGQAISHGLWAFIRTYLIRRGFLDGPEGFMLAVSNAEVTYYRYLKLYYLQQNGSDSLSE